MTYQKIVIVGNLGRDPEMRYSPNGQPVTNISVATTHQYSKNNGEKVKETTWFKVSIWGKQAESVNQYLSKGSKVLVEGRMIATPEGNPKVWGEGKASFEINAQTVRFLDSRSESSQQKAAPSEKYAEHNMPEPDDDIPF